jgi:hypothetical protein
MATQVEELWLEVCRKDLELARARAALVNAGADVEELIDRALPDRHQRGPALRLLASLDEPRRRPFLPVLTGLAFTAPEDLRLILDVVHSLDGGWLAAQLDHVVGSYLGRPAAGTDDERRGTAEFLERLDPRLHAAFLAADGPREPERGPSAVLRLALESLRAAPSGVAQRAIDAALGWSALVVPTSDRGDPVVRREGSDRLAVVAFSDERATESWPTARGLPLRRDPALRVVWRALGVRFEGILLDPGDGSPGVVLPRADLRSVVAGRPRQEVEAGDDLALRLAVDAMRAGPTDLGRDALAEALAHGSLLVPASGADESGGRQATIATHEGALFAFTDREAARRGPAWTGDTLAALSGPAVLDLVVERGWSALTLNADETGELTLPLAEVAALRG